MSLLDSDDFIFKQHSRSSHEERPVPPPLEVKGRVKSGELTLDTQKISSFSLRRKKEDDKKTHKKTKSIGKIQPPDSPKMKSGPSPNFKSSRKQYAHLLENELSSDGEEDDCGEAFVLSKGRQAREKRGSLKLSSGEGPLDLASIENISPTRSMPAAPLTFPVSFTPPQKTSLESDLIPPLPPPPQGHTYQPPQLQPVVLNPQTTPTSNEPDWSMTDELYDKCNDQFKGLHPVGGLLTGDKARDFFLKSKLPLNELSKIWKLSDIDNDGSLSLQEFIVAMKLVLARRQSFDIPLLLPDELRNIGLNKQVSAPLFKFPPPPPSIGHTHFTPSDLSPPILSFPPLLLGNAPRSKTEPTIAISDAQTDYIIPVDLDTTQNRTEEGVADILVASFMSEGDVPLLTDNKTMELSLTEEQLDISQLSLIKGLGLGVDSTDEDDTSNLVTSGEYPVAKPRKKKRPPRIATDNKTEFQRLKTVHGHIGHSPPPRPPPYKKKSCSPTSEDITSSIGSATTDNDLLLIVSKPLVPPKPNRKSLEILVNESDRGHGRSTSWDLTKMLRDEGDLRFHEDVPSAEPPKPPPRERKDEGGYRSDDDNDGRRVGKVATPLQRSASTGSLASIGVPTTTLPNKSRTSSIESGALLMESGYHADESLLRRASTLMSRRPAPAPPPNKPKKPIYPPSFKKVIVDMPAHERSLSGDQSNEDSLNSAEIYQKKSKSELQKSIKRFKEENNMYNNLNNELNKKLYELKQERYRLEARLNHLKPV